MRNKISILALLICIGSATKVWANNNLFTELSGKITYVVDINGSGDYIKLQDAINASPNNSSAKTVIFVKNGTYFEKIYIPSTKTNLVLIGEDVDSAVISYDDYSGRTVGAETLNTFNSETFRVDADDFRAMNITIENSAYSDPAGTVSQAPALITDGDRQVFLHCKLWGFQDTYYSRSSNNRAYFKDCLIAGTVDYIFGESTIIFDSCQVHSLRDGGYMTAASTEQGADFGYVFMNCRLTAPVGVDNVYLGRPWKNYPKTVFFQSYEGTGVHTAGWRTWNGTEDNSLYAEYKCYGPGSDTTKRISWSRQLTDQQAAEYTMANVYSAAHSTFLTTDWSPGVDVDTLYQVVNKNVIKFLAPYNVEASISDIKVNGASISNFNSDSSFFLVELPSGTTEIPEINVVPENENSKVEIIYPDELPGYATVNLIAKYEASYKSVDMYLSVDNAFTNAKADSMSFNKKLVPNFDPDIYEYSIQVEDGTTKFMPVSIYRSVPDARSKVNRPDALPGQYVIVITAADGVTEITYKVNVDYGVGINSEHNASGNFFVVNPVHEVLNVEIELKDNSPVEIEIFNLNGSLVSSKTFHNLYAGKNTLVMDVSYLESGVYTFRFMRDGETYNGKILKK